MSEDLVNTRERELFFCTSVKAFNERISDLLHGRMNWKHTFLCYMY